jgi:hypothetical protein
MKNPRELAPRAVLAAVAEAEIAAPGTAAVTAHLTSCSRDCVNRLR